MVMVSSLLSLLPVCQLGDTFLPKLLNRFGWIADIFITGTKVRPGAGHRLFHFVGDRGRGPATHRSLKLDAGMWRYHANRMDARRSQFDLGWVDAYN